MTTSAQIERDPETVARSKWPRLRSMFLISLGAIAVGLLIVWLIVGMSASRSLRKIQTQADKLDPGWRWEQLLENRATIPPKENSAIQVQLVLSKMKGAFPKPPKPFRRPDGQMIANEDILARLNAVPLEQSLDISLTSAIRRELRSLPDAIIEARKLAEMGKGRLDPKYQKLLWATLLPHIQNSRDVTRLLQVDAVILAQDGEIDAALDDCRAILGVGRSIGDDPFLISQLVRMASVGVALTTAERVLNRGEASDAALAKLQTQLLAEADEPLGVIGVRGERAMLNDVLSQLAAGDVTYRQMQGTGGNLYSAPGEILSMSSAFVHHNQAIALERMSEAVEISKRPLHEQPPLWKEYDKRMTKSESTFTKLASSLSQETMPAMGAYSSSYIRTRAQMFAMVILIAAERHRLAHGEFPRTLEAIDHRFLTRILVDPYSGGPLKLKPDGDGGLIVYSVSYDGVDDNGAKLEVRKWQVKGFDLGFRIRAKNERNQPPKQDTLPDNVFQQLGEDKEETEPE